MVKFSKQLDGQLVPEWKDAYCNYKELKRDVNRIKQDRSTCGLSRNGSVGLMSSWSSISQNFSTHLRPGASAVALDRSQSGDVLVVHKRGHWNEDHGWVQAYETQLMEPLGHAEQDRTFFTRLDEQLNKIDTFYKAKEAEYVAQAIRLEKQLLFLFDVQESLARQSLKIQTSSKRSDDSCSDEESDFALTGTYTSHDGPLTEIVVKSDDRINNCNKATTTIAEEHGNSSDEEMEIIADFIENVEVTESADAEAFPVSQDIVPAGPYVHKKSSSSSYDSRSLPSPEPSYDRHTTRSDRFSFVDPRGDGSPFHNVKSKGDFQSRLQKVRETVENRSLREQAGLSRPRSIIQDMIDMSLSKKKIQSSEKMLRTAFIEFYRGLGLLKSYSSLNMVAFAKILKKYDKVVKWKLGPLYIREVERSYFATSDKVTELMGKVEGIFTKHFSDHDRRKAMAQLRPMQQRGGHRITFFVGLFSGTSAALLVAFLVLLITTKKYRMGGGYNYMDTVFHVFSTLGLVLLHMYMYGWNVYAWQRTRINYAFIFEFSPGTELRYREVLLVCTGLTSMLLGAMVIHIVASTREAPDYSSDFLPMAIVLVFIVCLFTPFNTLYRSSRAYFLRCMQHILLSPFYKVVMADFFLGDQLTSQVASLRNFEFMACYYSGGYFHTRDEEACNNNKLFQQMMYVFSLLPYWWRFLQCLRRWRDEGDKMQLFNAGKYASAMVAVAMKVTYQSKHNTTWLVLFVVFSCFAAIYQLYWDIVIDWGLLQRKSKNPWLRDSLILKKKYCYFLSMWVNAVLRLAWISSIQRVNVFSGFSQSGWDVIFAALEIIRRGHWNFYRLENEHLNNVGKYRAVKTVPLPFKEFDGGSV